MRDIAVYGAGGFGCEIACLIKLVNESLRKARWNFIGFFDDNEKLRGASNKYGKILGGKSELNVWDMSSRSMKKTSSPSSIPAL